MSLATYVVLQLAEFTALAAPPMRTRDNLYHRIHHDVATREMQNYNNKYARVDNIMLLC